MAHFTRRIPLTQTLSNSNTPTKIKEFIFINSLPLQVGIIVGLIWVNLYPLSYEWLAEQMFTVEFFFEISFSLADLSNISIALLFGLAFAEILTAFRDGGKLSPIRNALNPLIVTAAGVGVPMALFIAGAYFAVQYFGFDPVLYKGFAIPTATDIALAGIAVRIVFGKDHPAFAYVLTCAIVDDFIGLILILCFYQEEQLNPIGFAWIAGAILLAYGAKKVRPNDYLPFLIAGLISYYGFTTAHLETNLCLLPIVLFLPFGKHEEDETFVDEVGTFDPEGKSLLQKFEQTFSEPTTLLLFFFGLHECGIEVSATSIGWVTLLIFGSILVGKFFGVLSFIYIAELLGFNPPNFTFIDRCFIGLCMAIATTVAAFVSEAAWGGIAPNLAAQAKLGSIGTIFVLLGIMLYFGFNNLLSKEASPQTE